MSTWPESTDRKGSSVELKDRSKLPRVDFNRCFACGSALAWVEFALAKSPKPMLVAA